MGCEHFLPKARDSLLIAQSSLLIANFQLKKVLKGRQFPGRYEARSAECLQI